MNSKKLFLFVILCTMSFYVQAQDGATLFKQTCVACHTIGKGRLVGPDLIDVNEKRKEEWLLKWIKSSQTVINSGDKTGQELFDQYNKIPMPDVPFSDDQIKSILAYIKSEGALASTPAVNAVTPAVSPDAKNVVPVSDNQTSNSGGLLNSLNYTTFLLFGVTIILLIVIWVLGGIIKKLSSELSKKQ